MSPVWRAAARRFGPPLLIYGLFAGALSLVAARFGRTLHGSFLRTRVWDINHYKSIAETGYAVVPCAPPYAPGELCGNPGWFPGWPLALRPGTWLFGNADFSAGFLAVAAGALAFVLLFEELRRRASVHEAVWGTAMLACYPGSFYLFTGFPYAFLLALALGYLKLRSRRAIAAGLAVAVSATYPTGCLLALLPLTEIAIERVRGRLDLRGVVRRLAAEVLPFAVGPLLFLLYLEWHFGDWSIYFQFQAQARYARGFNWPHVALWNAVRDDWRNPEVLAVASALLVLGCAATRRLGAGLWVFTVSVLSFSLFTGTLLSIYRHYLFAFGLPLAFGLARRPAPLKAAVLVFLAAANYELVRVYLTARLI